jgi:hypothetical protein
VNARERQIQRFYAQERGQKIHDEIAGSIRGLSPASVQVDELGNFHALEKAMDDMREEMGRLGSTALVGAAQFKRLADELGKATGQTVIGNSAHYKGVEVRECSWIGDDEMFVIDENALTTLDAPQVTFMLVSPGLGTVAYWCAIVESEVLGVERHAARVG